MKGISMARLASIGLVLGLLIATMGPATAHDQKITDGQNDALDYSDGSSPAAETATPLDFRSILFSETSRKFVVTIRFWQVVTPEHLCDGSCSLTSTENEGVIFFDFFKGSSSDPKAYYFLAISSTAEGQYVVGVYNAQGNFVSGAVTGEILDEGLGFRLRITRGKLKGYPKGAKLKWIGSSAYHTDANGQDCVPDGTSPFYGACWDFLPDSGPTTHTLRK